MDNSITPVEDLIRAGFAQRFYETFGYPLNYTTSVDKKAMLARLKGQAPSRGDPFAFATPSEVSIDEARYSPVTLLRRGIASQASHDHVMTYRAHLLPTINTFQFTLLAQSITEVTDFAKAWLFSCLRGHLKFSVTYGVVDLDVHVDLDRNVSIPARTDAVTEENHFELTATFRIFGYLSENQLRKVQAVTEVVVEGFAASEEQVKALNPEGKDSVRVFLFNKPWSNAVGPTASTGDEKTQGV